MVLQLTFTLSKASRSAWNIAASHGHMGMTRRSLYSFKPLFLDDLQFLMQANIFSPQHSLWAKRIALHAAWRHVTEV
jgi:hypothetical protein